MRRLYYILPVMLALFIGCAEPKTKTVLQYRPQFLACETATATPAGAVFDPPALAHTTAFGQDVIGGVSLNYRWPPQATGGYFEGGEVINYRLYYHDRQADPHGRGHYHSGYLHRAFYYTREGVQVR